MIKSQHALDIETENSRNIFAGRYSLMNHVGVEDCIRAEAEATENCINNVLGPMEREVDGNDARHSYQPIELRQAFSMDKKKGPSAIKGARKNGPIPEKSC